MSEISQFKQDMLDKAKQDAWLAVQSPEVITALITRITLRTVPFIATLPHSDMKRRTIHLKDVVLPSLRAASTAWALGRNPKIRKHYSEKATSIAEICKSKIDSNANAYGSNGAIWQAAATTANLAILSIASTNNKTLTDMLNLTKKSSILTLNFADDNPDKTIDNAYILDIIKIGRNTLFQKNIRGARKLLTKKLWLESQPDWLSPQLNWLETSLPSDEYWDVWTRWYEGRLKGHPANEELELFRMFQPEEFWEQEPAVINKAIWDKEQKILAHKKSVSDELSTPPEIPAQLPGVHVEIDSKNGKIVLSPPDPLGAVGNDIAKLESFQPQIKRLAEEALSNISANEQPELRGALARYFEIIDKPLADINFDLVFFEGLYLEEAALAADRKVAQGLREPLSDAGLAALKSLNRLHPLFVLNSKAGQENLALAREYESTEEERKNEREAEIELAEALKNATDFISSEVVTTFDRIVREEDSSQHPERTRSIRLSFAYNVTTCLVIGAAPSAMAAGLGYLVSGGTGAAIGSLAPYATGLQNLVNESLKQSDGFKSLREPLTDTMNKVQNIEIEKHVKNLNQTLSESYKAFLLATEGTLRKLAGTSKQLQWVHKNLDWLKSVFKSGPKN